MDDRLLFVENMLENVWLALAARVAKDSPSCLRPNEIKTRLHQTAVDRSRNVQTTVLYEYVDMNTAAASSSSRSANLMNLSCLPLTDHRISARSTNAGPVLGKSNLGGCPRA